mgnify:CR=1 FL=1
MDNKTKLILGGAVVVVGAYFLMNRKKKETEMIADSPPMTPMTPTVPTAPTFSNSINIENSKNKSWVGIPSGERTKATALLKIGTIGSINGTTPCSITEFYIDKNGKKGAFKCEGQDYYELPGGSTFSF